MNQMVKMLSKTKWKYVKMNRTKFIYIKYNWKLVIHLLFRTYHFGVNNNWWNDGRAFFGLPICKFERWHIVNNYRRMRFRAQIGFVSYKTYKKLFNHFWF